MIDMTWRLEGETRPQRLLRKIHVTEGIDKSIMRELLIVRDRERRLRTFLIEASSPVMERPEIAEKLDEMEIELVDAAREFGCAMDEDERPCRYRLQSALAAYLSTLKAECKHVFAEYKIAGMHLKAQLGRRGVKDDVILYRLPGSAELTFVSTNFNGQLTGPRFDRMGFYKGWSTRLFRGETKADVEALYDAFVHASVETESELAAARKREFERRTIDVVAGSNTDRRKRAEALGTFADADIPYVHEGTVGPRERARRKSVTFAEGPPEEVEVESNKRVCIGL